MYFLTFLFRMNFDRLLTGTDLDSRESSKFSNKTNYRWIIKMEQKKKIDRQTNALGCFSEATGYMFDDKTPPGEDESQEESVADEEQCEDGKIIDQSPHTTSTQ